MLFKTVLVAADFSENSREAFRLACWLAPSEEARLTVLYADEPTTLYSELDWSFPPTGEDQARCEAMNRQLREFYAPDRPMQVEYRTWNGFAVEGILRVSKELGVDLIVMGTHGKTGLRRLLAGSVAEAVLEAGPLPGGGVANSSGVRRDADRDRRRRVRR